MFVCGAGRGGKVRERERILKARKGRFKDKYKFRFVFKKIIFHKAAFWTCLTDVTMFRVWSASSVEWHEYSPPLSIYGNLNAMITKAKLRCGHPSRISRNMLKQSGRNKKSSMTREDEYKIHRPYKKVIKVLL